MPTPDLISLFVAPLNRIGARYAVTGAVAAIVYGQPRLTDDIDLVLDIAPRDAARLHAAFSPDEYYVPPTETIATEARRPS